MALPRLQTGRRTPSPPDLAGVVRASHQAARVALLAAVRHAFPWTFGSVSLVLRDLTLDAPEHPIQDCLGRGRTYSRPLLATLELTEGGEPLATHQGVLLRLPEVGADGTILFEGRRRVVTGVLPFSRETPEKDLALRPPQLGGQALGQALSRGLRAWLADARNTLAGRRGARLAAALPALFDSRAFDARLRRLVHDTHGDGASCPIVDGHNALQVLVLARQIREWSGGEDPRVRPEARELHPSQRGLLCPLATPSGSEVGLVSHLALGASWSDEGLQARPLGPAAHLSPAVALVPFVSHDDGIRAGLGARMQGQALPLQHPEPPLVGTGLERAVAATTADDDPCVVDGELALGRNLRVAYLAWEGHNFEDAVVLSETAARKLTAVVDRVYTCDVLDNDREELTADVPGTSKLERAALDFASGLPRVGAQVRGGMALVGKVDARRRGRLNTLSFTDQLAVALLGEAQLTGRSRNLLLPPGRDGEVIAVQVLGPQDATLPDGVGRQVRVTVRQTLPVQLGDKLAGRHGNKGVVGAILPDDAMPRLEGEPVEVLLNPLGVPSRLNPGQLLEVALGRAALALGQQLADSLEGGDDAARDRLLEHLGTWDPEGAMALADASPQALRAGLRFACPPFQGPAEARVGDLLALAGLARDGRAELIDPATGAPFPQRVTTGVATVLRLEMLAAEKAHARSWGPYDRRTGQPVKGRARGGGQRLGEMEVAVLHAHGAHHLLQEALTLKSDAHRGGRRLARRLLRGQVPAPVWGGTSFRLFQTTLQAMGLVLETELDLVPGRVDRTRELRGVALRLATSREIAKWSKGAVNPRADRWGGQPVPPRDGLHGEVIFGPLRDWTCRCPRAEPKLPDPSRPACPRCGVLACASSERSRRFGHLDLPRPVLHPWAWRSVPGRRALCEALGLDRQALEDLVAHRRWVVTEAGGADWPRGRPVDRPSLIAALDAGATVQAGVPALVALLADGPLDVRTLSLDRLPVLPAGLRHPTELRDGRLVSEDLDAHYTWVIRQARRLAVLPDPPPDAPAPARARALARLAAAWGGLQLAVDALIDNGALPEHEQRRAPGPRRRPLRALFDRIQGKQGLLRRDLGGRRVDYSARAVIVPGPELGLDQVGLPRQLAWQLYRPFVTANLDQVPDDAILGEVLADPSSLASRHLQDAVAQRPVVVNRQPSLHRHSVLALEVALVDGLALRLHPLVCAGLNADFDGDEMSVHLPLTPGAVAECRERLLPSRNQRLPANGAYAYGPTHEAVQGWRWLVTRDPDAGWADLRALLPDGVLFEPEALTKASLDGLLGTVLEQAGPQASAQLAVDLMRVGFDAATRGGLSFALDHLPDWPGTPAAIARARAIGPAGSEAWADAWRDTERQVQAGLRQLLEGDPTNPLALMLQGGARGSWNQLLQLAGLRGLMWDARGHLIPVAVADSLRSGVPPDGHFASAHGARKGLIDTGLNTGLTGHFYARLLAVSQPLVVAERRCGLPRGRRGVLACQAAGGPCADCYGTDPSTGAPVLPGTPIGALAAQAVGERATQLTLRTFHGGGAQEHDLIQGLTGLIRRFGTDGVAPYAGAPEAWVAACEGLLLAQGITLDTRHLQVLARCLFSGGEAIGLGTAIGRLPGFLARASAGGARAVLARAALQGEADALLEPRAQVITGRLEVPRGPA